LNFVFGSNQRELMNKIKKKLILDRKINAILFEATNMVRTDAVDSIARGAKSGITYTKYNPRRTHTASAQGQAPATDTGNLIKGITTKIVKSGKVLEGQIIANAKAKNGGNYAKFLEFGTVDMLPRPFLHPAFEKNRKKIMAKFRNILKI
tara:strand:+ start:423 stop:872 length:450 start_codon:yes stop_codon:yes gene_type:complete